METGTKVRKTEPPPGYTVNEGGNENAYGWFYSPSEVENIFYRTRKACVRAAWKAYRKQCAS